MGERKRNVFGHKIFNIAYGAIHIFDGGASFQQYNLK